MYLKSITSFEWPLSYRICSRHKIFSLNEVTKNPLFMKSFTSSFDN